MKKVLTLFIGILLFTACKESSPMASFDSWIGTWTENQADGVFKEAWTKDSDTLLLGTSSMVSGKDTLFQENIRLILRGKDIFYIPTVPGQNEDKPVEFKLIASSDKSWTFENKAHDYPSQIIYTLNNPNSITATIQGTENNRSKKFSFYLKRK
jgi:lipopolysaccharide export LptBFGC system permease protein LptF